MSFFYQFSYNPCPAEPGFIQFCENTVDPDQLDEVI